MMVHSHLTHEYTTCECWFYKAHFFIHGEAHSLLEGL